MAAKKLPAQKAAAFNRLEIIIEGIADRVSSAVDSLADEMTAAGASPAAIRRRVELDMESGKILSEMRDFARARVPGFAGDMTFRFARDTLAAEERRSAFKDRLNTQKQELASVREDQERGVSAMDEATLKEREEQAAAIISTIEAQGIDIGSYVGDEFPEPPPDTPLTEEFMWVAVEDKSTCSVCHKNHGKIKTLQEWSEIGEPRSGACLGETRCRCVLVPVSSLNDEDRDHLKDVVTVVK